MCVAIPSQVVEVREGMAIVDVGGARRHVSLLLLPEARVGDFVIVHAGFAIKRIDEWEAQETLRLFHEIAEAYLEAGSDPDKEPRAAEKDQEAP